MNVTLRPLDLATDLPRVTELINTVVREPVTQEVLAAQERVVPEGLIRHRLAAVGADGGMVGYGTASRAPWAPPGRFTLQVTVDPALRGQGIGSALYAEVLRFAREQGATRLRAEVRDDDARSLQWAERRGFRVDFHLFESTLQLAAFDEAPFRGALEAAEAAGFHFTTLAELGDSESVRRQAYDLIAGSAEDDPGHDGALPPFEVFNRSAFGAPWFRPDLLHFAMDGHRMAGYTWAGYLPQTKAGHGMGTGVDRAYRGRRLTLALKLLSIRAARQIGAERLVTNNDSRNAPMLAVNRKLGYEPQPGIFMLIAP